MKPLDFTSLPLHSNTAFAKRITIIQTIFILSAGTLCFMFIPLNIAIYVALVILVIGGGIGSKQLKQKKKAFDSQIAEFQMTNSVILLGFLQDYLPVALKNISPNVHYPINHPSIIKLATGSEVAILDVPYYIELPKSRTNHFCSTAVIATKSQFPHLYLESKKHILEPYRNSPKLQLEGDFNKTFTVYVPEKLEIDALTILTPDVMQTLQQYCSDYDIEFYGNSVYFIQAKTPYTQTDLPPFLRAMTAVSKELNEMSHINMDETVLAALQTPVLASRQPLLRHLYDAEGISGLIGIGIAVLMVVATFAGAILKAILNRH